MVHAVDESAWVWRGGEWRRFAGGGLVGVCVGGRIVVLDDGTAKRALTSATLRPPPNLKAFSPESKTTHHLRAARRLVRQLTSLLEKAPNRPQLTSAQLENISTSVQTPATSITAPCKNISTAVQTSATPIPAAAMCKPVSSTPSLPPTSRVAARSLKKKSISVTTIDSSSSSDASYVSDTASSSESDSSVEGPRERRGEVHVTGGGNALKVSGERVRAVRAWLARGRVPGPLQGCWRRVLYKLNPIVSLTPSKLPSEGAVLRQRKRTTPTSPSSPVNKPGQREIAKPTTRPGPFTKSTPHKETAVAAPTSRVTRKQDKVASPSNQLTKPCPSNQDRVESTTNQHTKAGPRKQDRVSSPMTQPTKLGSQKHTVSESSRNPASPTSSSSIHQFRQPYSAEEDEKLIQWLCQDRRWERVGGVTLWRQLESSTHLPYRSWQSLKNRYYKNLLQRLNTLAPMHLVHEMRANARPAIRNVLDKKKRTPSKVDKAWAR